MPRRRSYERLSPPLLHESRRRSVGGNDAERIAFTQRGDAELGSANLYRIRQHGLKHRLKFAGGTRDDSQHLRGRRLLLQRLAELARERLKLLLKIARVRLELLFRRSLRFLRRVKMTHAGRPKRGSAEAVHAAGPQAGPHPWSNSEHFRCCPRTCRSLRDTVDGGE